MKDKETKTTTSPSRFLKGKPEGRGGWQAFSLHSGVRTERCTGPHVSHFNLKLGGKKTEINNIGWRICQRVKRTPFEAVLVPDLRDGVAEGWEGGVPYFTQNRGSNWVRKIFWRVGKVLKSGVSDTGLFCTSENEAPSYHAKPVTQKRLSKFSHKQKQFSVWIYIAAYLAVKGVITSRSAWPSSE